MKYVLTFWCMRIEENVEDVILDLVVQEEDAEHGSRDLVGQQRIQTI